MYNVYILLTCTGTIFSRLIKFFTRRTYTHASIALDANCDQLYSFARRQVFPPFPAGFIKESTNEGIFAIKSNCKCAMYRLEVDEYSYKRIVDQLSFMYRYEDIFQYNYLGAISYFFHIPHQSDQKYFCSEFVAEILETNDALKLPKPASLFHPSDFTQIPELNLIYEGTLKGMKNSIGTLDSEIICPQFVQPHIYSNQPCQTFETAHAAPPKAACSR